MRQKLRNYLTKKYMDSISKYSPTFKWIQAGFSYNVENVRFHDFLSPVHLVALRHPRRGGVPRPSITSGTEQPTWPGYVRPLSRLGCAPASPFPRASPLERARRASVRFFLSSPPRLEPGFLLVVYSI